MIRAFLAAAAIPLAALVFAMPALADSSATSGAAPVDVFTVGPLSTDCYDSAAPVDGGQQPQDIPEPPPPTCYGCDSGYHCENNRCVAN